jgi:hypothetical protein
MAPSRWSPSEDFKIDTCNDPLPLGEDSGSSAEVDLNRSEERVPRRAEGHCRYRAGK